MNLSREEIVSYEKVFSCFTDTLSPAPDWRESLFIVPAGTGYLGTTYCPGGYYAGVAENDISSAGRSA